VESEGEVVKDNVEKTADDTIFVMGTLSAGVPVSMTLRRGRPLKARRAGLAHLWQEGRDSANCCGSAFADWVRGYES
jgi:hypothetical protein